jgi:hypothetical protein
MAGICREREGLAPAPVGLENNALRDEQQVHWLPVRHILSCQVR